MTGIEALPTALIVPPDRAPAYLRGIGIAVEDLYAAVRAGERAAAGVDAFAPVMAAGLLRWVEVVSTLRRRLVDTGEWTLGDRRGQPICRHLTSGRTLAVMSGDVATGNPELPGGPHTVRRKGAATADSFAPHEMLFSLAELGSSPRPDGAPPSAWVFFYRRDGARTHLEVSQPTGFDRDTGQLTGFAVRVIVAGWRPGDRRDPQLALGRLVDLQLVRSVA